MRAVVLALLGLAACDVAQDKPAAPSVPGLYGLTDLVTSDRGSDDATRSLGMWSDSDPDCAASAYPALALVAEVAPHPGPETILGSYANGVVVLDREGQLVAATLGYPCAGSADELEQLVAGNAFGDRTIGVVGTTGGHRESSTWIGLFRVGFDRRLDPVFTGNIEERRGSEVRRGAISMLPNALVYQRPGSTRKVLYVFDPVGRAYLVPGEQLDHTNHDGPASNVAVGRRR